MDLSIRFMRKNGEQLIAELQNVEYLEGTQYMGHRLEGLLKKISGNELEYLGGGVHKDVYGMEDIVFKVTKDNAEPKVNHQRQVDLRMEFSFLPAYYGTIISASSKVESFSFYERTNAVNEANWVHGDLLQAYELMIESAKKGYVLDLKPDNFGWKDGRIHYIDEGGLGKGIPPDYVEGFESFKREFAKTLV